MGRHGTFEQQVATMSRAGVVMMAHGAAATNSIFQVHRSVFIEVFPYMRKRFGFMQAAGAAGQFYMPIFSWDKVRGERGVWGVQCRSPAERPWPVLAPQLCVVPAVCSPKPGTHP